MMMKRLTTLSYAVCQCALSNVRIVDVLSRAVMYDNTMRGARRCRDGWREALAEVERLRQREDALTMRLDAAISDARDLDEAERSCAAMLEDRDDALGDRDAAIARAEEAERLCVALVDATIVSHYHGEMSLDDTADTCIVGLVPGWRERVKAMRARVKP